MLPVEILREAVESYSPYLQASGEMHDPVFGEPTQYGTPYHAFCNAVLAKEIAGERKSAYADRAVRGLGAALDHVLVQSDTSMIELLSWISHQEETWIEEERGISVGEIETAGRFWSRDLSFLLKNVRDRPLIFGSPTTEGRPAAGYGGSSGGGRAPLAAGRYWPRTAWRDRK